MCRTWRDIFRRCSRRRWTNIHNQAFNAGANELNHQIIELAQDRRGYRAGCQVGNGAQTRRGPAHLQGGFRQIRAGRFPDFKFKWNARSGAAELYEAFKHVGLNYDDYKDKKFTRLKWLHYLLDSGKLDGALRWKNN